MLGRKITNHVFSKNRVGVRQWAVGSSKLIYQSKFPWWATSYKPAIESRQTPSNIESRQITTDLKPETDKPVLYTGEIAEFGEITVIDKLAGIIEGLIGKTDTQPGVPIADKLLLTLPEAQALTGLSREFLRNAINERTLKAKMIGRCWQVKRSDLDEYVGELF